MTLNCPSANLIRHRSFSSAALWKTPSYTLLISNNQFGSSTKILFIFFRGLLAPPETPQPGTTRGDITLARDVRRLLWCLACSIVAKCFLCPPSFLRNDKENLLPRLPRGENKFFYTLLYWHTPRWKYTTEFYKKRRCNASFGIKCLSTLPPSPLFKFFVLYWILTDSKKNEGFGV